MPPLRAAADNKMTMNLHNALIWIPRSTIGDWTLALYGDRLREPNDVQIVQNPPAALAILRETRVILRC